ncbi:MAG TPA: ankyrin repeat domain-containing protein [Terriglobia bacterium]|nr:ankyrin repeat domain-containing protein [Terriglobia bacterium]
MTIARVMRGCYVLALLLFVQSFAAASSDIADAVMNRNKDVVRSLLQKKVDVNGTQVDGTTALHWAVRADDLETADLLIRAGANVSAANRDGVTPMQLAAVNGTAPMIEKLIKAGANPNASLSKFGDTALMLAARTGKLDGVKLLLDNGAQVNAIETWGGTNTLMWAVSERHLDTVKMLIDHGAAVNIRSYFVPSAHGRGFEGATPEPPNPKQAVDELAGGWLTPLMFAAREGDLEIAKTLVAAGADLNAIAGDGKDALGLAIFNGQYELASYLIDNHVDVNHADAQRFTPLFWAVDRRNMELGTNGFPWTVTTDPLPLIKKLLDAGANPNAVVNNTPRGRNRNASPRIVFASALHRAAFAGDLELSKVLLAHGADPHAVSSDRESMLEAAAGLALIPGYQLSRPNAERVELSKLLVELGEDVNWADAYGITPLMAAANLGNTPLVQYLVDQGADLGAYDLGKRLDGAFMASVEPLMPVDYAIGVGTFLPNNSVEYHGETSELMLRLMKEKGIKHTTSECTLRGFTCSTVNVDPKTATPAEIVKMRRLATGNQLSAITGGLSVKEKEDHDKDQKDKK